MGKEKKGNKADINISKGINGTFPTVYFRTSVRSPLKPLVVPHSRIPPPAVGIPKALCAKPIPPPTLLSAPCVLTNVSARVNSSRHRRCLDNRSRNVGKGEIINLSYNTTFWNTKERFLIVSLLSHKKQKRHKSLVKEVSATSNVKAQVHSYKHYEK